MFLLIGHKLTVSFEPIFTNRVDACGGDRVTQRFQRKFGTEELDTFAKATVVEAAGSAALNAHLGDDLCQQVVLLLQTLENFPDLVEVAAKNRRRPHVSVNTWLAWRLETAATGDSLGRWGRWLRWWPLRVFGLAVGEEFVGCELSVVVAIQGVKAGFLFRCG